MTVTNDLFNGQPWARASWLGERPSGDDPGDTLDADVRRWAAVLDQQASDAPFTHAVRAFGFSMPEFRGQLASTAGESTVPPWVERMESVGDDTSPAAEWAPPDDSLGLIRLAGPFVRDFQRRLHAQVAATVADEPRLSALPDLLAAAWPADQIAAALSPTMILELNVARVSGELAGETPQERFNAFTHLLARPATAAAIWSEYPVLLRFLHDLLDAWVQSRAEFATQLAADLSALDDAFGPDGGLGACRTVHFGAGDRHRGGRSVGIVRFDAGAVVYKPRSLAADLAWQRVIDWFNEHHPRHRLETMPVLDLGDHGWSGFVPRTPCENRAAAQTHYWRLGALLALLYAMRAKDMHTENLIASGAHPIVIDLEALIHPDENAAMPWRDPAARLIQNGVTSIGLLPQKMLVQVEGGLEALDFSALAAPEGQRSPFAMPTPMDPGTDEMRLVDERGRIQLDTASRVRVGAEPADPREYRDELIAGFVDAYRMVQSRQQDWLAPGGLLDGFAAAPLRYIPRPTSYYVRLLSQSLHPDYLRDALDRDRTFFRLAFGADGTRVTERLIASELADLRVGDVPFFSFRPDSRDVWDSHGRRLPDVLAQRPSDVVAEHLGRLGDADLTTQVALIRRAFASLETGLVSAIAPAPPAPFTAEPLSRDAALSAALDIGRRLSRSAIRVDDEIGWVTLRLIGERHWSVDAAPSDLYSGVPGIGLFLSSLAAATNDAEVAETAAVVARAIARQARSLAEDLTEEMARRGGLSAVTMRTADAGAFGMIGGTVYYLAHAASLHDDADLLEPAEALLPAMQRLVLDGPDLDLLNGAAGAIVAALALDHVRPSAAALDVAVAAGQRLLSAAIETSDGICWRGRFDPAPLTGMSHGAAGIAFALARLDRRASDPSFRTAISGALRYERSLRDENGNWPDLRSEASGGGGVPLLAWCHGAPGIGLARLAVLDHPGLAELHPLATDDVSGAERALWTGLFGGPPPDSGDGDRIVTGLGMDGACHGTLGNLELPYALALRSGDRDAERLCRQVAATVAGEAARRGWRTGVPDVEEIPSLMVGVAGIGYQLLRLADPEVPSLLMLEPPRGGPTLAGSVARAATPHLASGDGHRG